MRARAPVVMSHRRRVPSQEPVRQNWPSEEITTSCGGEVELTAK